MITYSKELHVEIDGRGLSPVEREHVERAFRALQDKLAAAIARECEEFVRSRVRRRFNEVFTTGIAFGICLAAFVVVLGHWMS